MIGTSPRVQRRTGLAVLAGSGAAAAWVGTIGLLVGVLGLGDDIDDRLPFESPTLAGVALGLVVAVPLSMLAVAAWVGDPRTDGLATIVGVMLVCWVGVQMVVLHSFSWLHPITLALGLALLFLGGRIGRRTRALLLVAAGAIVVGVGVGLLPHVIDANLSPASVMSVFAVVGGLVAIVIGARWLLERRHWTGAVGGGVAIALALAVVTWLIAPPVAATHVPPSTISSTPGDRGLDAESIVLTTADDVRLAAWYVAGTNDAAVVLLHGAGSTRSNVLDHAEVLARNGYGVLMIDARGHGNSDGEAMDFGWYGDLDIAAGTDFLESRPDVDPRRIGVIGMSMGGEEAIGAAATNATIGAVVAEGATGRAATDKGWLSDEYGWRGAFQEQFEKVQSWVADYLTEASVPVSLRTAVESSGGTRFLLITAGDLPDEGYAADFIASGAPERVERWEVEGSGHTAGLTTDPTGWEARVVGFLDDNLGVSR